MKFLKHSLTFILGLFFMAGAAYAQGQQMQQQPPAEADSVTDEELEQFAEVATEVQDIQQESQQTVDSLLSEKDMDMQRFQEIMMSQQDPNMTDSAEVTEEEQQTIEELEPALMQMQQDSQEKLIEAIEENNLDPQRYQEIMQAVRSDPEVMERFQEVAGDPMQQQ